MTTQVAMVSLYGLFPLVCYIIGSAMMMRFKLDETEHARIRAELERRRTA
jgi:Na+/melibiose symporter-like transporter